MRVTFGMALDGYRPMAPNSSLGEVIVGPRGLLGLLEIRLGLSGVWSAQAVRVAQYQRCLKNADHETRFYSDSFRIDALAVSETLLRWRDEWIRAGWDGRAAGSDSRRLRDLADVEAIAKEVLGAGVADRLCAVIEALAVRDPGIDQVRVVDPLTDLPPVWRRMLKRLPAVAVDAPEPNHEAIKRGSDLARLHYALRTRRQMCFGEDGSFFLLTAGSEQTLSCAVAALLGPSNDGSIEGTTVITGQRGHVLNQGLGQRDLPMTGQTANTPWRPAPQVLRLALSVLWRPLDPHRLLEFLTHPVCPIRRSLRARLASAVAAAPGIGGVQWQRLMDKVRTDAIAQTGGDERAGAALDEEVKTWFEVSRFNPSEGAPTDVLTEHCARVGRWAGTCASVLEPDDPQRLPFLAAQAQAMSAAAAIDELAKGGVAALTRHQLDRLIDQATANGSLRPDVVADCGHVHAVTHPGALIEAVSRVVWWDFSTPDLPSRWPWAPNELAQLRLHGAELPSVDTLLQIEARHWLRPVLFARRQLVLVVPRRRGNEPVAVHPLWDHIVALAKDGHVPAVDLDSVLERGGAHPWLTTPTGQVPHRPLPRPKRWWSLIDARQLAARDEESFSSLNSFINTPHQWVLRYPARLRPGSLAAVPVGNRQKGALLHRLFEWLFTSNELDWRSLTKEQLVAWVDGHFLELLAQEGANLLLPGQGREVEDLRAIAINAAWELLRHLRASGAEGVRMEVPAAGHYCGGRLSGRIDMLVAAPTGREAVLDLKWGGRRYRCDELRENRQLQLAVYSVMRRQETERLPSEGYFVLDEARMLAQTNEYFADAELCVPREEYANTTLLWAAFEATWGWRRAQLDEGLVEVNAEGTEPDVRSAPPAGALPPAEANDRFDDYVRLIGWPQDA
jgi:RecB family exonuclease